MASLGLGYYGSWLTVVDTITTDQQNLNLWTYISTRAASRFNWNRNGGKKLRGIITINSGVNIYSTNPLTPAIIIPADSASTFRSYDQVIIINNGNILGAGGVVGAGGESGVVGFDGGRGGTAIYTRRNLIISNNGNIYGGGGGGGGGGGAYDTGITDGSTNCSGAQYCNRCCLINCQGRNFCGCSSGGCASSCTPSAACGSTCYYASGTSNCNGSTVGTCNWRTRWCTSYKGGNGGKGQQFGSNTGLGIDGVYYSGTVYTGDGGNGGAWGQNGSNGTAGTASNGGNGGDAGCWIDGFEFVNISKNNDERGNQCNSTGSQTLPVIWSGWSSTPSITTQPSNGSGVTLSIDENNLIIEPRQALTSILVNSPTNLGGTMNASNCTLLESLLCSNQNITTLNLTNCLKLKTLNFTGNNLTTLNISSCTSMEQLTLDSNNLQGNLSGLSSIVISTIGTRLVSIQNNNMSAQNLNDIFNQLPARPQDATTEWSLYINNNTGVCTSNWEVANDKGWTIYPTLYKLSKSIDGLTISFNLRASQFDGTVSYTVTGITSANVGGQSLTGNMTLYQGAGQVIFNISNGTLRAGTANMVLTINSATCSTTQTVVLTTTSSTICDYSNQCTCCDANPFDGCPPAFSGDPCYRENLCFKTCGSCSGGTQYCVGTNVTTTNTTAS
jgi:hypothetical protein